MRKEEFEFLSSDGKTKIHGVRWCPEGEVKAVLQIAHGMAEYIERYDEFAVYLAERGYLVTGNDHLGHGKSVSDREDWGYFAEKNSNRKVLEDLQKVQEITKKLCPDVPCFLLGHSMGSFLCRQIIAERGTDFAGAILMGTGYQPGHMTAAAKLLCRLIASVKGWRFRSPLVDSMAFGSYNEKFGVKGGTDWLSTVPEHVRKYNQDPACGFMFTLNGYYGMFDSIHHLSDRNYISGMPKELPVLIVSGADDPVGDFGEAPKRIAEEYRKLGMKNVTLRLYPGDRHEILGEKDRRQVSEDIYSWLSEAL